MKNQSLLPLYGLSILFLAASFFVGHRLIQHMNHYKHLQEQYTENLGFQNRLLNPKEWLLERINPDVQAKAEALQLEVANSKGTTTRLSLYLVGISFLFFVLVVLAYRTALSSRVIAFTMLIIAVLCLYVGICAPMLEIAAFERDFTVPIEIKVPVVSSTIDLSRTFTGDMYFYYQSKSIMDLVSLLFKKGNYLVGISIMLFSVCIPAIKLIASFSILLRKQLGNNKFIAAMVHKIGKWSMADVFVVATFLAFLAFNNMSAHIKTESKTLLGLYFFMAYCILSISSSYLIDNYTKPTKEKVNQQE